ncbi:hypothetical protein KVT40_000503 [Elsinoe batatas]|uniref:Uncharacterized protein n=1 Tax=Elsinoe batatas TaxID=2601811 RepID=A0A8K0PL70_9PEZI|nr:hypothetical protein KVT40_000503 [Elsinoe batatas]
MRFLPDPFTGLHPQYYAPPPPLLSPLATIPVIAGFAGILARISRTLILRGRPFSSAKLTGSVTACTLIASIPIVAFIDHRKSTLLAEHGITAPRRKLLERYGQWDMDNNVIVGGILGIALGLGTTRSVTTSWIGKLNAQCGILSRTLERRIEAALDPSNQMGKIKATLAAGSYGSLFAVVPLLLPNLLPISPSPNDCITAWTIRAIQKRRATFAIAGHDPFDFIEAPSFPTTTTTAVTSAAETKSSFHDLVALPQEADTEARHHRLLRRINTISATISSENKMEVFKPAPPQTDRNIIDALEAERKCLFLDRLLIDALIKQIEQQPDVPQQRISTDYRTTMLRNMRSNFDLDLVELGHMLEQRGATPADEEQVVQPLMTQGIELPSRTILTLQMLAWANFQALTEHQRTLRGDMAPAEAKLWQEKAGELLARLDAPMGVIMLLAHVRATAAVEKFKKRVHAAGG